MFETLEASDRFRRDTLIGGIFHLGKRSFRELTATDSVHIVIDGNRLSAHVDDVSPLKRRPDGSARYSWPRIVAHNVFVIAGNLARRAKHRHHHQQRCDLDCQVVWVDEVTSALCCEQAQEPPTAVEVPQAPPVPSSSE